MPHILLYLRKLFSFKVSALQLSSTKPPLSVEAYASNIMLNNYIHSLLLSLKQEFTLAYKDTLNLLQITSKNPTKLQELNQTLYDISHNIRVIDDLLVTYQQKIDSDSKSFHLSINLKPIIKRHVK